MTSDFSHQIAASSLWRYRVSRNHLTTTRTSRLSLLNWVRLHPGDGSKKVVLICLQDPGSTAPSGNFGGTIAPCDSADHLVKPCERNAFQAEGAEAESCLFPQALNQTADTRPIRLVSVWFLCMLGSLSSWFALIRLGIWIFSKFK